MFLPLVVFRLCISVAYFVCSFSALFHVFASFLRRRDVRRGCCVRETNTPLHVLCWQSCRVALQEPFLNIPFTYMYIYICKHSIKNGTVSACQIMVWTQYYLRTHSLARVGFTCTCLYVSFANLNIPTFEPCARSDCKLNEYKRIFAKFNRDNRPSMRKEFKRKPVSLHSFCSNPLCVCLVRTASAPLSHRYTFALHQPPRLPGHLSLFHQIEGSEEDQLLAFEKYCLQVGACLS